MNGAAKALRLSQPTVARRIRALEDQLGIAVFERGPNHLALTAAGRAVLEAASPMA
jgi:DNA-binding transcriptional LysR family regulator